MKNNALAGTKYAPNATYLIAFGSLMTSILALPMSAQAAIAQHKEPYISYTVQPGDKLLVVSRTLLADPKQWNQLAKLNGLKDPNVIRPGQVLDVPRSMINFANQPKLASGGVLQSANGQITVNGSPAQAGQAIPEGAQVQAAASSSAVVKLSDGSTVQLMPRSLAQVVSSHGYAMKDPSSSISTTWFSGAIRLLEGVIDVAANKLAQRKEPMGVTTPTANIGVRGTQFRVAYEDPAERTSRTEVLEGKVRTDTASAGADVAGGFGVAVKPNEREIKVVALLPALPTSALPERVQRAREGNVAAWTVSPLAGAAAYRAELAQDAAFTQIVLDIKSPSPAINLTAAPNGNYFARVRGIDANGIEGFNAARPIQIADAPVSLIWIREINIAATADFLPNGLLLRVNTSSSDAPRNLQVQIAQDPGFTQGVQSLALAADSTVIIPGLNAGERRFLRFAGTNSLGIAGTSPVLLLELPANWGSTVFGMTSALQPLR
ncbi:MAG: LysM peptidoglycan-binding domain-containing protein [Brachymonas sp.]|nr:LysM peptidoglycan-binding domain-containing protein [Brachymonas sp.]